MVARLTNPQIRLGTKTATVVALHDDGRLEVLVSGEGGGDKQQFVAFDAQYLDVLLKRFASSGV
jgi:hypothetical protein